MRNDKCAKKCISQQYPLRFLAKSGKIEKILRTNTKNPKNSNKNTPKKQESCGNHQCGNPQCKKSLANHYINPQSQKCKHYQKTQNHKNIDKLSFEKLISCGNPQCTKSQPKSSISKIQK